MKIKADLLKRYMKAVSKIDGEPCLNLRKDGINSASVDPAHVCIITVNIPASDDLVITEEPMSFCLDAKQFDKYLGSFQANSMLDFTADGERCIVTDGKIKFTARLLAHKDAPKVPRLTLPATATIPTKDFKAVMSAKYDNIRLSTKDGVFTVSAGDETDSIEVTNRTDYKESVKAQYPADYLAFGLLGDELKIQFGNDLPVTLTPQVEGMEISLLIAPRIEND